VTCIAVLDNVQAEKELSEVNLQLESLHERLEEADGLSSAQVTLTTLRPPHCLHLFIIIVVLIQTRFTVPVFTRLILAASFTCTALH